ncbi:MAG: PaaI family thioesterase [Chloroflexi bacterium]|nr:PaaI family thioesterase [Chloroflexota bacterium]
MSVPDLETWRARWRTPESERLGVRGDRIEDGFASFIVDLRYGDERDHDALFHSAAVTHAADVAVLSAVMGQIDEHQQQQNGTASIHLNFLRPLSGVLTVAGRIASWGTHDAIVEVEAHDERGALVLKGLSTYSLRPRAVS